MGSSCFSGGMYLGTYNTDYHCHNTASRPCNVMHVAVGCNQIPMRKHILSPERNYIGSLESPGMQVDLLQNAGAI